jgi:hypothetical protein
MCSQVFRVRFNRGPGREKVDLGGIKTGRLPTAFHKGTVCQSAIGCRRFGNHNSRHSFHVREGSFASAARGGYTRRNLSERDVAIACRYVGDKRGRTILWASTMKMFDNIHRTLSFRPNPDPFLMKDDLYAERRFNASRDDLKQAIK